MMPPDRKICPQCGELAECDSVDVGVGLILNTEAGFYCGACGWQENSENDFGFVPENGEGAFAPIDTFEEPTDASND